MVPTFDIECVGWVNPIAVGFFDGFTYHEFVRESEEDDPIWRFLDYIREHFKGMKLYAHCAAKYDNKFILSALCKKGEVVIPEAGLARLRWKGPNIYFEDSYLLLPMSLKRMTQMFSVEEKGEWDHSKDLKPWEMGDQLIAFKDYLRTDCISLSLSMDALCEELGYNFGITPSISLSTTSAKAFDKCFYDVNRIDSNEEFEEFIRKATYGGRNEVYRRYGEGIRMYDIKSMYVSCYDTPVPIGRMRWVRPNIDNGTIAEAFVKVPKDMYVGPLPYRREGRLMFPTGEFKGWWDIRELQFAGELGVDMDIRRQLLADEEPVLKAFGEATTKLREEGKSDLWKMFGLSLSGKFGQGRWKDIVRHISEIKDFEGYHPLDTEETYFQTKEYRKGRAPYVKPAISARIRAEARIRHLKVILDAMKAGQIFYGDTDSIFTTTHLPSTNKTGELSFLGEAARGYFIKQKLYGVMVGGKLRQKSAGYSDLKLSEKDFQTLLNGGDVDIELDELPHWKKLLSEKDVELIERSRALRGEESNSRHPVGIDTEPIHLIARLKDQDD